MNTVALVLGILALIGMIVGFFPCLGWFNWFNIPFAFLGLVVSIVAVAKAKEQRGLAIAGLVMCVMAVLIGLVRLILGGGVV